MIYHSNTKKIYTLACIFFVGMLTNLVIFSASAQNMGIVSGKVTNSAKEPLIGAAVMVKGGPSTNAAITDINGEYSIRVLPDAELEFSYIGYKPVIVKVSGRTSIDVILEEDTMMLNEVVAIGYGSSRKEDLSMAVVTMKMDDIVKSRPQNIGTILQGRLPGVTVMQSGDPMSQSSFSIRGRGSKGNDGDPNSGDGVLFVVDGVPGAPFILDEVETITVLKDAASAAIYGASVGSSGVVLITTKRPQSGSMNVNLNVSMGFDYVTNLPKMLTAEKYNEVWAKAVANAPGSILPSAADPSVYPFGNVTRTDWLKEIFRKGFKQHYGLSMTGGNDRMSSVFTLSYDHNKGVILNTWTKSLQGKLQTDFKLTQWLKFYERLSIGVSNGQGDVDTSHQGPIMGAVWYPRCVPVYEMKKDGQWDLNSQGERYFGGTQPKWASVSGTPLLYNPVAALTRLHNLFPSHSVYSTTGIEIKPLTSLTIKSEFTADLSSSEHDSFNPVMKEIGLLRAENHRAQTFAKRSHWLSENTITYAQLFGRHHISAMGGFTADFSREGARTIFTRKYSSEESNKLLWGLAEDYTSTKPTESRYEYAMVSFFGRVGYSYDDRYFITGSIRRDASSKLPVSKNFDWFPSVSGSWKLTSEHFMKNSSIRDIFSLIKFRAGWGKVGNVDMYPNNVADVELLTYRWPIIFGKNMDVLKYGTYLSTIPNLNARWETTVQTSAGLDLSLFKNRLDISIDWYNKETRDLIDRIPVVPHMGISADPMGNMGNVINRGWEFSVNYNGSMANGELTYNIYGNFSTNKGYVREYGIRDAPVMHSSPNIDSRPILYSDAGHPWYSFMIYKTDGIFRSQQEIDNYTWKDPETGTLKKVMPSALVGDLKFVDTNNDGVINDKDRVFAGSYAPVNTFSFGGSLQWKGIDFSIMFQGVSGNYIYNGLKQLAMNGRNDYGNLIEDVMNTWDFNPESSRYPRLGIVKDNNGNYNNFSDIFLEKGDYLRLKNLTIGYTVPKFCKHVPGLRVYASMDNLLTFTRYSGVDPEVGNYGVDRGVYPVAKFVNFGINMKF